MKLSYRKLIFILVSFKKKLWLIKIGFYYFYCNVFVYKKFFEL